MNNQIMTPQKWSDLGYKLCSIPRGTKGPLGKVWHLKAADPALINGHNMGVIHGLSGTCSLDIDDGDLSVKVLHAYGLDAKEMIDATFAWTARKGRVKLLYRVPEGLETPIHKLLSGSHDEVFSVRGGGDGVKGAQDVLPPSIHPKTGSPYYCLNEPRAVADLPFPPKQIIDMWTHWEAHKPGLLRIIGEPVPEVRKSNAEPSESGIQLVDEFNRSHSVGEVLERNGYEPRGNRWLRPGSESGIPGVVELEPGRIYSHGADNLADGYPHDAFDCFRLLEHGGNWASAYRACEPEPPPAPEPPLDAYAEDANRDDSAPDDEDYGRERPSGEQSEPLWPPPVDLKAMAEREPEPPVYIIDDWLPQGYATLVAGHGGAGKSWIVLYLCVCIALGLPFFGAPVSRRRVRFMSCEDREGVLHWRLARVCAHLGVNIAELDGHLVLHDLVGSDSVLWEPGKPAQPAFLVLRAAIESDPTDVLVLDGVADTFAGNENDRSQVKRFVNTCLGLVDGGRGALMLVAHVNKMTASVSGGGESEGYSGSTGWHNAVRARWYLHRHQDGDLRLELQKNQFGEPDLSMRFAWDDAARLFVGQLITPPTRADRTAQERRERDGIMAALDAVVASGDYVPAATSGSRTAYNVLSARSEFPESLLGKGAERKRFWAQIEALRSMGTICEGSIRRKSRHFTATLERKGVDT